MTNWIEVGMADSILRLGARTVRTKSGDIAVFRTTDDSYYALDDKCPHRGGPLSQGLVHGHKVTCPLHNFVIELKSGEAVAPDEGCVRRHEVKVEQGRLYLAINSGGAQAAA